MAATFPLSLASLSALLPLVSAPWNLDRQVETSGTGAGEAIEADLGPPLWRAECESAPLPNAEAMQLHGRLLLLNGGQQAFYLSNPAAPAPQSDPDGAILGASAVKVKSVGSGNVTLAFKSLPAGYALTIGDFVAVDYGAAPTRRALFMLCGSGVANGSGETAELEVRPAVRPGIAADAVVSLAPAAAKVKLLASTLRLDGQGPLHSVIRFTARQTLQAG